MTTFSKDHLIQILSSTQRYKETEAYLNGVKQQNQSIYNIINQTMLAVMESHTISPITKLQTLRLFKDIFLTCQFNCIENLSQDIQQHIFTVAAYNIKSKKSEKGNNYFIEVQKRQNTKQNKQLSLCYVTFAMQLVKNMAIFFPKDFENQQSRYTTTYQSLIKNGLTFPKKNQYFFANDGEKFKKNLEAWLTKEKEKRKKVENKQVKKQSNNKINQQGIPTKSKQNETKVSQNNEPCFILDDRQQSSQKKQGQTSKQTKINNDQLPSKESVKNSVKIQNKENINILPLKQQIQSKTIPINQTQSKIIDKNKNGESTIGNNIQKTESKIINNEKIKGKKILELSQIQKQQQKDYCLQNTTSIKLSSEDKLINQIKYLKLQNTKITHQFEQTKKKLQIQTNQLIQTKKTINILQKKSQQNQNKIKNQQIALKQKQQTIKKLNNELQQKIKNLPKSKNIQSQNEFKQLEQEYQKQFEKLEQKLGQIGKQNKQLKEQIQKLKNKNKEHQNIDHVVQQELMNTSNFFRKSGFIADRTPQKQRKNSKFNQMMSEYSMSNYLAQARKQQQSQNRYMQTNQTTNHNTFYPENVKFLSKTQNSLKKYALTKGFFNQTDSHKIAINNYYPNATISNEGKPIPRKGSPQQRFHQDSPTKQLVSIIPFIENYFAPLNYHDSVEFKAMCLTKNSNSPIYSNEIIQVRIMHTSSKKFILSIRNKSSEELIIDLKSQHDNFIIENNQKKTLEATSYIDYTIKASPIDLNLRFPIFKVTMSTMYQKLYYSIPIPITLLNYCCFTQTDKCYQNEFTKKYKTQKFALNKRFRKISTCLPELQFYSNVHRTIWLGQVKHTFLRDSDFLIRIVQENRTCQIEVQCRQESIGQKLSKVLLQILLFLLM